MSLDDGSDFENGASFVAVIEPNDQHGFRNHATLSRWPDKAGDRDIFAESLSST